MEGKAIGFTNKIGDKYIPTFDFDGITWEKAYKKARKIQKKFKLGEVCLFETKNGFHIVYYCNQVPYRNYLDMLYFSKCDPMFTEITEIMGESNLRLVGKHHRDKKLKTFLSSPYKTNEEETDMGKNLMLLHLKLLENNRKIKN